MIRFERRFDGKAVLVTGAAGGLGKVLAQRFAAEGAAVIVADVLVGQGESVANAIREEGGRASFVELNVTSLADWQEAVERAESQWGALHVLVNNAGVISRTGVRAVALNEWQHTLDINLKGPMLGIQAVAPLIRACGGGSIVNISSTAGLSGHPGIAYSASKWGLRGVTKSAALDLLDWGIRVNSVHPAQVSGTSMTSEATPGWRYANDRAMPAKRAATPDEVANAVLFLAADESSYVNATEIVVDGGAVDIGLPRVRTLLADEFSMKNGTNTP